jgi:hypothetical protein
VGVSEGINSINEVLKMLQHEVIGDFEDLYDLEADSGAWRSEA